MLKQRPAISGRTAAIVVILVIIIAGVAYWASVTLAPSTISFSSSTSIATTTSKQPYTGGITVEMISPIGTADPLENHGSAQQNWLASNLYETLFYFNKTSSSLIPWLATGYTVSQNASVWTFTLRQGVTFSDGTPFNATAVKDSIDYEIVAHNGGGYSTLAPLIRGANTYIKSNHTQQDLLTFVRNDGITIVDPYTITFHLVAPFVALLSAFSSIYTTYIMSPSAIQAHGGVTPGVGNTWLGTHSAGTGPYVLQSFNTATGTVVLAKNPHYWAASALGVKQPFSQVTINIVTNPSTEELDIRTGVADMIFLPHTELFDFANKTTWLTQRKLVSTVPGVSLWGPYPTYSFDAFMLNSKIYEPNGSLAAVQPFQNPDMVAAFNYAWNQTEYIETDLNGLGIGHPGLMNQGQLGYQYYPPYFPFNLTLAKNHFVKACAALGCSPNNPLHITMVVINDPDAVAAAALLASNVNSLNAGVILDIVTGPYNSVLSYFLSKTEGIFLGEFVTTTYDPLIYAIKFFGDPTSGFAAIYTGFSSTSQIVSLINQASETTNVTQRANLMLQADKAIAQTGHYINIAQFEVVILTSNKVGVDFYNPSISPYLPTIIEMSSGT